jgi:hypothetical protein
MASMGTHSRSAPEAVTRCPHCGKRFGVSSRHSETRRSVWEFEGRVAQCLACRRNFFLRLQKRRSCNTKGLLVLNRRPKAGPNTSGFSKTGPRPTGESRYSFRTWYQRHLGRQPAWVQCLCWTFGYGFLWMPAFYWLWKSEQTGRISKQTAWIWRIAIAGFGFSLWQASRRRHQMRAQADLIADAIEKGFRTRS